MPSERDVFSASRQRVARRRWFRPTAVLLSLSPLVVIEALCVCFGWGRPARHDDPFVGFRSVRPLFVLNEDRTRYEVPAARQMYFRPESFPAKKANNEFRVFCLGGSTVQGRPFAIETSFTTWLEISLQAADSRRRWEVVNCGGISYATYRLVPILRELLGHEPDLIILYTGHNEFLEDRSFEHVRARGEFVNRLIATAGRLRTFTLMREGYLHLRGDSVTDTADDRPQLPTEVESLLDYRGGLEAYHRDDRWRRNVIAQFRHNVRHMVEMTREAGVDLILVNPVSNLSDSPPFKSEPRADLGTAERRAWVSLRRAAREHLRQGDIGAREAVPLLEQACEIDPLHAATWYMLAECTLKIGKIEPAREAYLRAKELDVCPLRILEPMNEAVLEIAHQTGTPLVDVQALFARRSPNGLVGGDWLLDHVHPGIPGHRLIADALADKLVTLGVVRPEPGWRDRKEQAFQAHLASLDDLYFAKGSQRLEVVRRWTQGRAELARPATTSAPVPR